MKTFYRVAVRTPKGIKRFWAERHTLSAKTVGVGTVVALHSFRVCATDGSSDWAAVDAMNGGSVERVICSQADLLTMEVAEMDSQYGYLRLKGEGK
jgi:hypothetical protein